MDPVWHLWCLFNIYLLLKNSLGGLTFSKFTGKHWTETESDFCIPSYISHAALYIHLHFIRDAGGHLQCSVGLCVLFKGIAGENFRSNSSILQLPAHSQKTPLSVVGINPTTFRLLVSLHIQANLGRGAGCVGEWVGGCGTVAKFVCVWLGGGAASPV